MADHETAEYEGKALSNSVPSAAVEQSARNFLIQVTLLHSTKPVVSRLLSVPPLMTFQELHKAFAASFLYKDKYTESDMMPLAYFHVMEASQMDKPHYRREVLLALWPYAGDEIVRDEVWNTNDTGIYHVFDEYEGFRYFDKCFAYIFCGANRIEHLLQVIGRATEDTKGKIVCLGGQGLAALADWEEVTEKKQQKGPSTWDLDLGEINVRLAELQKDWSYPVGCRP